MDFGDRLLVLESWGYIGRCQCLAWFPRFVNHNLDEGQHSEYKTDKGECVFACRKGPKAAYPTEHKDTQSVDHPDGGRPHKAQEEPDGIPVELKIHRLGVQNGSHKVPLCSVES